MALFTIEDIDCKPKQLVNCNLKLQKGTDCIMGWLISPYDKFSCPNEEDVYKLERKLNDMGCKTRVGRNMENGVLSVVVLEIPNDQYLLFPEINMTIN